MENKKSHMYDFDDYHLDSMDEEAILGEMQEKYFGDEDEGDYFYDEEELKNQKQDDDDEDGDWQTDEEYEQGPDE